MAIDGCPYTFQQLARRQLPGRMRQMRRAMRRPHRMSEFGEKGIGGRTLLRRIGRETDFSGCYVLLERGVAKYVGISRGVVQRLIQHVKGDDHFSASLAYTMASERKRHDLTRGEAMKQRPFRRAFERSRNRLRRMSVAFIEIEGPVERYLFEIYCAMSLDTEKWNTFETH